MSGSLDGSGDLVTVSDLAFVNREHISSIDLNPLVVGEDGRPAALDARIQLAT
jgi:succinyl-CoA synthetase beta subunit